MLSPNVIIQDGKAITTSIDVANYFHKQHKDVIRKIQSIGCSKEFNERNFTPVAYLDNKGEKRPAYQMTKDGFIFLVMGFTGKKAALFKEAYINAFNQMENELNNNLGLMHSAEYRHESHLAINTFYEACEAELKKVGINTPELPRPDTKVLDGLISGMLMSSRFLLSFDHNLKVQISQVPMNACIINTSSQSNMSTIMREFVPIELIPELMQIGLQRLSRRIN